MTTAAAPTTTTAPLSALNLYPIQTRAMNPAAPPYNPALYTKTWTTADPGPFNCIQTNPYNAATPNAPAAAIVSLNLQGMSPIQLNLPGAFAYPPVVPNNPQTVAMNGDGGTVNGLMLCTLAQASAVAAILGGNAVVSKDPMSLGFIWGTETRQMWLVSGLNAAYAYFGVGGTGEGGICQQNFDPSGNYTGGGVGAPGVLTIVSGNWNWALTPDPGLTPNGNLLPSPCGTLWAGWDFAYGPLGAGVQLQQVGAAPGPSSGGGSCAVTPAIVAQL